ncbi:MAG: potassium channel protein [Bacteroidetes bacterium]|nr:potassium channel protein [Bacteroidota bacterium]
MFALPRWQMVDRMPQRLEVIYSILFLIFWTFVGIFGYKLLEGWSFMDGLYMSFITLTTIGYTEVDDLSDGGRIFTILYAVIGIGSFGFVTYRWARILVAGAVIRKRRLLKKIRNMKDHYIICGYGRVGVEVTSALLRAHKPLVVLDKDKEVADHLNGKGIDSVAGDAVNDQALHAVGITHARGLIILLPDDAQTVYVTLVAREINPDLFILARASDAVSRRRILQAGASQVISPVQVGAQRMAQVILRPHVEQFMSHVLQAEDLGLGMEQVIVEAQSALDGKTLREVDFRNAWETIVIAIMKKAGQKMHFYPQPDDRIEQGDTLIVLGSVDKIDKLTAEGCQRQVK